MNDLTFYEDDEIAKTVLKAYRELAYFQSRVLCVDAILNQYGALAETLLMNYMATQYADRYYDGSPENSQNYLTDQMKVDGVDQLGIPSTLNLLDLIEILERYDLFYEHERTYHNVPLQGVW